MSHLAVAKHQFDIVDMDHVSIDHQSTGNQKVLTVVDQFTKYAFFIHVSNEKAATTAKKLMDEIFTKFGFPNHIHSDNGSAFRNSIMRELTTMCNMKHTQSLPYTPQGNAMCERLNKNLLDMLGIIDEENKKRWRMSLSALQYAYDTTVHATSRYSLFYLMFGRHSCLVGDIIFDINMNAVYKNEYIREVRRSLQTAYLKCKEAILKSNNKHKG